MKNSFILASFLLLVSVFLNVFLYLEASPFEEVPSEIGDTVSVYNLADAISLLPQPELAVGGYPFGTDKFWVWTAVASEDGVYYSGNGVEHESWVVDLQTSEAVHLADRSLGAGSSVPQISWGNEYVRVEWSSGWEGLWMEVIDYIDIETGALAYSLENNSGQRLMISAGETALEIAYDPVDVCAEVSFENPTAVGMATGLLVNGTSYPFPSSIELECTYNDMGGQVLIENFDYINLNEQNQLVRIGLAEGVAEFPLSTLSTPEILYSGIAE